MEENKTDNKDHKRSASYPGKTLEKTISFVTNLYNTFSANTYIKREEWATIQKIHPNSVARDFAAATQYNLMEKSTEGYKITNLFVDIFKPENPAQKKVKILKAFGSPRLYASLIEKFDGHVIPNELPNTLVKHHSITDSAAQEAAEIFLDSAIYCGALNESRVLRFKDTLSALEKTQYAEIVEEIPSEKGTNNSSSNTGKEVQIINTNDLSELEPGFKKVPIHLTKNKIAYFGYPADMSEKDVKLIEHQLQGILMRIQFENEERVKDDN